jgi:hypothetical protein
MKLLIALTFSMLLAVSNAQVLPLERSASWTLASPRDTTTQNFQIIDVQQHNIVGDSSAPNDAALSQLLNNLQSGAILEFPAGDFLFHSSINLPSDVVIRGEGAENTRFIMDLGGSGHAINIQSTTSSNDTSLITITAVKDSNFLYVFDASKFNIGDWFRISQNDSVFITSSWALGSVGQILQIKDIRGNKIVLESPLRMDFDLTNAPYIKSMNPVKNVGIECIKILRIDDTSPQHSSNIRFNNAVNCWVQGVESENCTYSHIAAERSSNLLVSQCYFHHAFDYGGGGRAYGVMLHYTSGECRIEDNIFKHLRHSMIVQAGANGNVFAYNYSTDPYWSTIPSNAAGDMVLHGNYVFCNLFEQNICQNIVIDNSHGPNGPYNTFFRNRAEGFGIFFSAANSPSQNIIGNEITNISSPYNLVNYTIQGNDHFLYGNNNKGSIHPANTQSLTDTTYAYKCCPCYLNSTQWAGIGTPNNVDVNTIAAKVRYDSGDMFGNICSGSNIGYSFPNERKGEISIWPNPTRSTIRIESIYLVEKLDVVDISGAEILSEEINADDFRLDLNSWKPGLYMLKIKLSNGQIFSEKIVRY